MAILHEHGSSDGDTALLYGARRVSDPTTVAHQVDRRCHECPARRLEQVDRESRRCEVGQPEGGVECASRQPGDGCTDDVILGPQTLHFHVIGWGEPIFVGLPEVSALRVH
jgi:hypothetical protein